MSGEVTDYTEQAADYGEQAAELPEEVTRLPTAGVARRKPIKVKAWVDRWEQIPTVYYDVKGKTFEEVCANLDDDWKSREMKEIGLFEGEPHYKAKYRGDFVSRVIFTPELKKTMPRWMDKRKASKKDKKAWNAMYKDLERHEALHRKFFKSAVNKIVTYIKGFKLGEIDEIDIKQRIKKEMDEYNKKADRHEGFPPDIIEIKCIEAVP